MTETGKPKRRWLRHTLWVLGLVILLSVASVVFFFASGAGNTFLLRALIHRLHTMTGAEIEIQSISMHWLGLEGTLHGVVVHGKEPAGTEPLFTADNVTAKFRIDSFWGRRVSLSGLQLDRPQIHIRVEKDGTTNLPTPPRQGNARPVAQTLFDLRVRKFAIANGWILYNDTRRPLAAEANDFRFELSATGTLDQPLYLGAFETKDLQFATGREFPVTAAISSRFTLWKGGLTIEQAQIAFGKSHFDLQASLASFADPVWTYKYRGWVDFLDFRRTMRSPNTPEGKLELRGEGTIGKANGATKGTGTFVVTALKLKYKIFHADGLGGRGSYLMDTKGLLIPDLQATAFSGKVTGRVTLQFKGMQFKAATHVEGVRIAQVFPALEERNFPIDELHWDSVAAADTVETWQNQFQHFQISGESNWTAPTDPAAGHLAVSGSWKIRYRHDPQILDVDRADYSSPTARVQATGTLGRRDSALDVHFESGALERINDFVWALRGIKPGSPEAVGIRGSAKWDGQITGSWNSPTFTGHGRGEHVAYGTAALDSIEGDITYSSTALIISRGHAQQGGMQAGIDGKLALTDWSFLPDNEWSAEINLDKVPVASMQSIFEMHYPVEGVLTGQFHGGGTRAQPSLTGLFDLAKGQAYGLSFDHLRGQLLFSADEVRINTAELRVFPIAAEGTHGAATITGSVAYRISDKNFSVDLVGAGLPLSNFEKLQSQTFPVGGQLTFRLKASGPMTAPTGDGTFRVVDLRVGQEVIGSFEGTLTSDGKAAKFVLTSAMTNGSISGSYTVGLERPFPIDGKVTIVNINLDPLLQTAMHLQHFDGHGIADGEVSIDGNLSAPESVVVNANFSRLALNYANVQLQNEGPVRIRTSKDEFNIEPATFRGAETDLKIHGNVHFNGRRTVDVGLNGAIDLKLLSGFWPDVDARGPAQVNAAVSGTLERPRITGKVHIEDASIHATDMPLGVNAIKGDFIFDANRLFFDNVTAEEGGGTLQLSGSVNYADRPMHYDLTARTNQVRVRYPEGISWLAGGNLRLAGTLDSGLISGRITVDRVTLNGGLDVASALIAAKEAAGGRTSNSRFLSNLQFDIEAVSSPGARMEWPSAEFEGDANLRVRGTWDHPILLGHVHVLSGELEFRGNRYRVSRGDLNFANPFQLNPDINVEASTTIQQYEITLNFSGPANKLALSYRSDPPLPGNDIITLLAIGQTSSEAELRGGGTGSSQGASAGASAILSQAISNQLGGRLERLFGITKLRVDPGMAGVGSTGSEQNAAARVTVEQQIAHDLTITYVSNVSSTQQQVIQVEYNVNRNVSIVALRDYNGTFGIDIKIKKRFP
jgi:translocation and assembly module TamB